MTTVADAVHLMKLAERLRSIGPLLLLATQTLAEVHEIDSALDPEVGAIAEALMAAQDGVGRAITFLDARLDAEEAA